MTFGPLATNCFDRRMSHLHVWFRTDLSIYLKVVEMFMWSSDWKCVVIVMSL